MKSTGMKTLALAALVAVGCMAVATPAQARWYDGRYWHGGHPGRGYYWNPRVGYYTYGPGYGYYPAPPVAVYAPPPPPPVVYAAPQPVYAAPVYGGPSVNLGVHIR